MILENGLRLRTSLRSDPLTTAANRVRSTNRSDARRVPRMDAPDGPAEIRGKTGQTETQNTMIKFYQLEGKTLCLIIGSKGKGVVD